MNDRDHDELAAEAERASDRLEHHLEELGERIEDARADWERKRADPSVPGAPPREGADGEPEVESPPGETPVPENPGGPEGTAKAGQ